MIRKSLLNDDLKRPDWINQERRDPKKIWLDKNECSDPSMRETVFQALKKISIDDVYSYPDLATLYYKLASFVNVAPENLLLTNGSDGAIRSCFEACMIPGDKLVLTRPTFAMYGVYARVYGANVTWLDYSKSDNGPYLGVNEVIEVIINTQPKMVCLPNPNSPTGTVFSPSDLRKIVITAGKVGALMLIDEAYHPLYSFTAVPWILEYKHLVVVRSFSKAWGAAGLRVGYAVADNELISYIHKQRPMYEIGNISAKAIEYLLDHENEMIVSVAKLEAGKKYFQDSMIELDLVTYKSHGNFLHVKFGHYSKEIHTALQDKVYYRKSFSEISLEGYSRFSTATTEQFTPIVECIKDTVKSVNRSCK